METISVLTRFYPHHSRTLSLETIKKKVMKQSSGPVPIQRCKHYIIIILLLFYFYFLISHINPLQEVTSACFSHYMPVLSLPFHAGSVPVGRGTIYHMILYAYVLWRSSIESLHSHASPATDIFSQLIFTPFFTHSCFYSIAAYWAFGNYCCCVSLLGGSAIRCQWCSLDPLSIKETEWL